MGFGGEVDNHIRLLILEYLVDGLPIPDVGFIELIVWVLEFFLHRRWVGRVGAYVDVNNAPIGTLRKQQFAKAIADEADAACD